MLGLVERAWSTEGHAEGSQFLVWSQIVSDAFGRLSLERPFEDDGASFRSACAGRRVGDLVLSSMSSQRQSVRRDEALIAGSPLGCYFVNVPLSGSGAVSQGGRTVTLGHGDVVVLDGDQPFRLEFARPFDEICMTIPQGAARSAPRRSRDLHRSAHPWRSRCRGCRVVVPAGARARRSPARSAGDARDE